MRILRYNLHAYMNVALLHSQEADLKVSSTFESGHTQSLKEILGAIISGEHITIED